MVLHQRMFGLLLLPHLRKEREHESKPDLIRRTRHPDIRDTCGNYCPLFIIALLLTTSQIFV